MFEDKDYIKNIVSMREEDSIVIPLYVQIYGQKYSLLELDTIKKRFSRSAFKVGYATADALFMNNSFPVSRIGDFDLINTFTDYDESMERQIRYTVFESGDVEVKEDDKLGEEIHMYFECLFNNVRERVDAHFKSLIEQDNVPIIPKDKETPKLKYYNGPITDYSSGEANVIYPEHIPVADSDDEDIPYPSADDEYDEYIDESDPLEDLRKEVAEYSRDDEDNLLIVETDNTGTEIVSATKVTMDLPKDDYLSENTYPKVTEGGIIGKETVDFINGDNDYSTDFDVF